MAMSALAAKSLDIRPPHRYGRIVPFKRVRLWHLHLAMVDKGSRMAWHQISDRTKKLRAGPRIARCNGCVLFSVRRRELSVNLSSSNQSKDR
jgi:hypothetical protein